MGTIPTGRTVNRLGDTAIPSAEDFFPMANLSPTLPGSPLYDGSPIASGDGNYLSSRAEHLLSDFRRNDLRGGGQVYDPYSPNLPAPVLDTPPSGYYSAIGEDGREEKRECRCRFLCHTDHSKGRLFPAGLGEAEYIPNVGERKSGMTTFGGSASLRSSVSRPGSPAHGDSRFLDRSDDLRIS